MRENRAASRTDAVGDVPDRRAGETPHRRKAPSAVRVQLRGITLVVPCPIASLSPGRAAGPFLWIEGSPVRGLPGRGVGAGRGSLRRQSAGARAARHQLGEARRLCRTNVEGVHLRSASSVHACRCPCLEPPGGGTVARARCSDAGQHRLEQIAHFTGRVHGMQPGRPGRGRTCLLVARPESVAMPPQETSCVSSHCAATWQRRALRPRLPSSAGRPGERRAITGIARANDVFVDAPMNAPETALSDRSCVHCSQRLPLDESKAA